MSQDEDNGRREAAEDQDEVSSGKTVFCGQLKLKGDAFEGFAADTVVKITGQVVFTTPVKAMPKCRLKITGQVIAPEGSDRLLAPAILAMTGQMIYYPEGVRVRVVMGKEIFDQAFLLAVSEKELLINMGKTSLAPDVQGPTLKEKIHSIINLGKIHCSDSLRPFVQVICRDNLGKIETE
jgi:hypothetical protein